MSSASSRDSKRVQAAILRNNPEPETSASQSQAAANTDGVNAGSAEETAANDAASSEEQTSRSASRSSRSSLALQRHRSHSMDNRPVDPSPIQVSHTVRMAGQRPIGTSPNRGPIDFSKSQTILNRPIAPNTTADDVAMVEYLD